MHKSLFTKGFWLAAAEKLYVGATAETANVVRPLAIHNSTYWKRGVRADGQKRIMQCVSRSFARTQWSVDTRNPLTRMTSWDKPDLTYGIQSRVGKRQFVMRKVKFTIEVGPNLECQSRLRQDSAFFFRTRIRAWSQKFVKNRTRSQSKFLTCEVSDFTSCTHAQSNILHTKYVDETDYYGVGIRVQVSVTS